MYRLVAILMVLMMGNVFAHGHPKDHNLGEEANSIKASGKVFHTDGLDVIRKMHPEFLNHKRDKTLREGVRTK
ncbi:MAG: sulfur reduction protein DsrJ, partial [Gammaproteobacteria bacterium]